MLVVPLRRSPIEEMTAPAAGKGASWPAATVSAEAGTVQSVNRAGPSSSNMSVAYSSSRDSDGASSSSGPGSGGEAGVGSSRSGRDSGRQPVDSQKTQTCYGLTVFTQTMLESKKMPVSCHPSCALLTDGAAPASAEAVDPACRATELGIHLAQQKTLLTSRDLSHSKALQSILGFG